MRISKDGPFYRVSMISGPSHNLLMISLLGFRSIPSRPPALVLPNACRRFIAELYLVEMGVEATTRRQFIVRA
jgi:hypothetical protein